LQSVADRGELVDADAEHNHSEPASVTEEGGSATTTGVIAVIPLRTQTSEGVVFIMIDKWLNLLYHFGF